MSLRSRSVGIRLLLCHLGVAMAVAWSATAFAADPSAAAGNTPPYVLPPYDQLDVNADDIVTLPEVEVHNPELARRIAHCDTNGDHKLSREEYNRCKPLPAKKDGS